MSWGQLSEPPEQQTQQEPQVLGLVVQVQVPVLQPPAKVSGRGLEPVQELGLTQEPPARARPPEQRRRRLSGPVGQL